MDYRQLGASGFFVPPLSLGTAGFRPDDKLAPGQDSAQRLVDAAIDLGITMFDSSVTYAGGLAEELLGAALAGKRDKVIISTKGAFAMGPGPNEIGGSRVYLTRAVETSLKRLRTDTIDIYQLHAFDAKVPIEETLATLDDLVRAGKIRYVGVSNFSSWHLMKSLAVAARDRYPRYCVQQIYYSLIGREFEWELMPLGLSEGVAAMVWSPLGWGRLTGKLKRGEAKPHGVRASTADELGPPVEEDYLFAVLYLLEQVAAEAGKSVPQVAINWLLGRPTVANVIVGARNVAQLEANRGAVGWHLTADQIARLDAVSYREPVYPYWHQRRLMAARNPPPV